MILYEPFKIKSVEPLPEASPTERQHWIKEANYNIFKLHASQITIDLLTDSGTAAMSDSQWAAMLKADETYAGSKDFDALEATVQELTGMDYVVPTHQGRAAEHLLFSSLVKPGDLIISNGLFDTTLANVEYFKAEGRNLPCLAALDPFAEAKFKGNIDLDALDKTFQAEPNRTPLVVITITNNTGGGQPVSLENIQEARKICDKYGKLLVIDACRFAENAFFIKRDEPGYADKTPKEIARECFDLADAITFSGKKDALSNIGGFVCTREEAVSESLKDKMIVVEGFPTYGGMAGYSIAAMNQGLIEVLDERYLKYRLRTISWMVEKLVAADVPVLRPAGGHAIYIESSKFYPQIPRDKFPGLALTTDIYIRGGIRGCELGSLAFGVTQTDGSQKLPELDLVRLAVPRRVYTEAHMGFVVQTIIDAYNERDSASGYEFLEEKLPMRHFRSTFRKSS
ncbi:MAG: tryptophanase [Bdellovibrionota bacterium]